MDRCIKVNMMRSLRFSLLLNVCLASFHRSPFLAFSFAQLYQNAIFAVVVFFFSITMRVVTRPVLCTPSSLITRSFSSLWTTD